jgi:hypothetical protein
MALTVTTVVRSVVRASRLAGRDIKRGIPAVERRIAMAPS